MSIKYFNDNKTWKLDTKDSSYLIHVVDEDKYLLHGYYGKRISDDNVIYYTRMYEYPFVPSVNNRDRGTFLDTAPFEYPGFGTGDFRSCALEIENIDGTSAVSLAYTSYEIVQGKPDIPGLPHTHTDDISKCDTLIITAEDVILGVTVKLYYSVFEEINVITRSARIINSIQKEPGQTDEKSGVTNAVKVRKAMSLSIDMDNNNFDIISLHGSWARERHIYRRNLGKGMQSVESFRGESSHQEHPFLAILDNNADYEKGEVYGFNFVYSGNFIAQAQLNQFDNIRIMMGINPKNFCWTLNKSDELWTPEAVMVYSDKGIDKMTQSFHDLYRNYLIRGKYKDIDRPVLINNWEATYFDFDSDKLINIAREAAGRGIELFVMDDGWFGNRNSDNSSLGDWYVNENKIKGGLKKLADSINLIDVSSSGKKMKFGLWIEPEMISPNSELFRAHPDYAISIQGRTGTLSRNQYVLDFSRKEVVDYIYEMIKSVLESANIEYIKWDMNRPLTDIGSIALSKDRQGEVMHRYMLGVYYMQERLINDFPDILLENCSGGGARFDAGMLYYSPQIWCSDDTDAIERLAIQEGTAICYPLSCIGAHVSDCPNHTVMRNTPFETRGYVALAGTFGYELDITKISEEDRCMITKQVEQYHRYHSLIQNGDYFRLKSYNDNGFNDSWMVTAKDKSEALITYVQVMGRANSRSINLKLRGLDEKAEYIITCDKDILCTPVNVRVKSEYSDKKEVPRPAYSAKCGFEPVEDVEDYVLHGDTLMNAGLLIGPLWGELQGDYVSSLIHLRRVDSSFEC